MIRPVRTECVMDRNVTENVDQRYSVFALCRCLDWIFSEN